MPTFEVTVRYRLEWIGSKIVSATGEESAKKHVEALFATVSDYATFEQLIADDSTPELDDENLEVVQVDKL